MHELNEKLEEIEKEIQITWYEHKFKSTQIAHTHNILIKM